MGILFMILGFIWWWPLGLVLLGFLIARRRRVAWGCGDDPRFAGDSNPWAQRRMERWEDKFARAQQRVERVRGRMERSGWFSNRPFSSGATGNAAFDDYRAETLRRLEDEQKEFREFLERLRVAKDRAEFDQFMAQRRPPAPQEPHQG